MSAETVDYLTIYEQWYPHHYGLKDYPSECHVTYTNTERRHLFQLLPANQQDLINQQRKYQVRSLFLQRQYLDASDWEFVGLNIDDDYERGHRSQLKCACGRPLKYQFVIESKNNQQEMRLGIQHFKDHLGITQQVAEEIKKGVTQVDLALDELLWLTAQKIEFPEDLWHRYVFAYYRNSTLRRPLALNQKLAQRVGAFREVKMPIFIGDYLQLVAEINQVDHAAFEGLGKNFQADKTLFETYLADFPQDIQAPVYREQIFWQHKLTDFIQLKRFKDETSDAAKRRYFDEVLSFLLVLQRQQGRAQEQKIRGFVNYHQQKYADQVMIAFLIEKFQQYQLTKPFFLAIPKVYRKGLQQAIKRKQQK